MAMVKTNHLGSYIACYIINNLNRAFTVQPIATAIIQVQPSYMLLIRIRPLFGRLDTS